MAIASAIGSFEDKIGAYRVMHAALPNDPPGITRRVWIITRLSMDCPDTLAKRVVEALLMARDVALAVAQIDGVIVSAGGRKQPRQSINMVHIQSFVLSAALSK